MSLKKIITLQTMPYTTFCPSVQLVFRTSTLCKIILHYIHNVEAQKANLNYRKVAFTPFSQLKTHIFKMLYYYRKFIVKQT